MIRHNRGKDAVTLPELVMAIFLLGAVVLTALTVELTIRRMSIRPRVESKLVDRLIPIIELIKKDFEYFAIGIYDDSGVDASYIDGTSKMLKIRVDSDFSASITPADLEHGYRWYFDGPYKYQLWYHPNANDLASYNKIADEVTYFGYTVGYANASITISLETKKELDNPYHPQTNPVVRLNTTIFSRKISAR